MTDETAPLPPEDEISLLDLLLVVAGNVRLLVLGLVVAENVRLLVLGLVVAENARPLLGGLLGLGYAFTITPTFTAATRAARRR